MCCKSGIYKITCLTNNKIYIGSAVNTDNRWSVHKKDFNKNKHCNIYFQNAWNKYGGENFKFEVIEYVYDKEKLIEREQHWLDYYKSYDNDIGYNIRRIANSNLGFKHSKIAKNKISKFQLGLKRNPLSSETKKKISESNTGKKRTEESKSKMRIAKLGNKLSEEHKMRISLSNKGKPPTKGRTGIPHTLETKIKISNGNKGKIVPIERRLKISQALKGINNYAIAKKVICLNTTKIYNSITDANNKYNTSKVGECCKGNRKSSGKHPETGEKLKWMYYEDYIAQNPEMEEKLEKVI